jgi:hypothetical protein
MGGEEGPGTKTGIKMDMDRSSTLTKNDVLGSEERPQTASRIPNYGGSGALSSGPTYAEEPASPTYTSGIRTEQVSAPLLFAIGPLIMEQMAMIRGTTIRPEAQTTIGMPNSMSIMDSTPEPLPDAPSLVTDEPGGAPEAIDIEEGTPEPRSGEFPQFESQEDRRGYMTPIAMLGSAIAMTLPPWVDRTIRAPLPAFAMDVTGSPAMHSRPKPPVEAGGVHARKEPYGPKHEERAEQAIAPPVVDAPKRSGVQKGAEREAERPLSEREVVRIVKKWMEEEAMRKGFL